MPVAEDSEVRWLAGEQAACRELAETLSFVASRGFAVEALMACCDALGDVPAAAVRRVIAVGRENPSSGHEAFSAVRTLTLAAEAARTQLSPTSKILYCAENAAKVIYNATHPADPFDLDSGEALFASLATFCCALPPSRGAALSERLLLAFRKARAFVGNAQDAQVADWAKRWLIGDSDATRRLATRMTTEQLRAFAAQAIDVSCSTLDDVSADLLRVAAAVRAPALATHEVGELKALARAKRASAQRDAPDSCLWLVVEQAVTVATDDADPGAATGYFFLLAVAIFYRALPTHRRVSLGQNLMALVAPW
jgi:hypothetical protein